MKKHSSIHKGFTLIELLVVVAIISILSAIILTALNGARAKAKDARIQSELSDLRAQMELHYTSNDGSYGSAGSCDDPDTSNPFLIASNAASGNGALTLMTGIIKDASASGVACGSAGEQWAVSAKLSSGSFWCVDSNGTSKSLTAGIRQGTTECTP